MAYETILTEIEDHVGLITLNRPKVLNALNSQLMGELGTALTAMQADHNVRCIIITGCEKAFAAGADVKEMAEKSFVDMYSEDFFTEEANAVARIRKPIIAAVSGFALGGGCELAMMCDFIIAGTGAKFGQPEIKLGVMAGMGGSQRMTKLVGRAKSMDMHLTGRMMDAAEALECGLVARVVADEAVVETAMEAARQIASYSKPATMLIRDAINRAEEVGLAEGLLFERRVFHSLFATEDQKEGMAAFIEKRKPKFTGK